MKKQVKLSKSYYSSNFIYSLASSMNFRSKSRLKKRYMKPKVIYSYYWTLSSTSYMKYLNAAKSMQGSFFKNFLTFIEGSLFMLVYRSNFVSNLFKLKYMMEKGVFLVDGQKSFHSNYNVSVGELVQVSLEFKAFVFFDMMLSFNANVCNWLPKNYLFMNYKFLFAFFLKAPRKTDFSGYPMKVDPYMGADIYFL